MLEEKLETLTKEVVALRLAIEKGGTAAGAKPAAKAKAKAPADEDEDEPKAKPKAKPKADEPEHDEDETAAIFRKAAKIDKPRCLKYLAKVECDDLAELLTDESKYDAAYAFAKKVIADAEDDD